MIIDIPEGKDPIGYVWGEMVPGIGLAASNFSLSVYSHTTLGLREFEAARLRIAQINGCIFCLDWRTERDGQIYYWHADVPRRRHYEFDRVHRRKQCLRHSELELWLLRIDRRRRRQFI